MNKAIVTSFNLGFIAGGEAFLKSAAEFHPDVPCYSFVPADEVAEITSCVGNLTTVLPLPRKIKGVPENYQVGVGRLFAGTINADCVAYFDSDVVICSPVDEYFNIPDGMVNAVTDVFHKILDNVPGEARASFKKQFPDVWHHKGFNAGVFSFHPKDWPDLPEKFEQILEAGNYAVFPNDQVILNAIFWGKVNFLPFSFNAHVLSTNKIPVNVHVVHFTCAEKPWMTGFPKHEPVYYYWVRYGLQDKSKRRLLFIRLRIIIMTPRRIIMRFLRNWFKK